eukprot:TRINITY_DN26708_c0_g1_i2.p4 TRINITY_DN26708_c0_g1~~TRINITY_DN26708_c0_g1_i2.p4  ORF type:complete len:144 (+),score=29.58 TRINITY_DN26708_c0_g1_i2:84-515(+)
MLGVPQTARPTQIDEYFASVHVKLVPGSIVFARGHDGLRNGVAYARLEDPEQLARVTREMLRVQIPPHDRWTHFAVAPEAEYLRQFSPPASAPQAAQPAPARQWGSGRTVGEAAPAPSSAPGGRLAEEEMRQRRLARFGDSCS